MRSITILLLMVSFRCILVGQTQHESINLFDGKSLSGWEYFLVDPDLEMENVWSVEDGLLICKGEPMGYLATKEVFTSFKLVVEWRWAPGKPAGNSGVLMRITGKPQALPKCTEAQLKHGSAGDIYGFHGFSVSGDPDRFVSNEKELTGKLTGVSKSKDNENQAGEWNKYEINLLKGNLTLYVNGEKVNEANGLDIVPGKIGFQSEGGEIHFRTIQLIPLESVAPEEDSLRKDALNVYMDASQHIRREISFINYVRDIKDAQLVILTAHQRTGAGGRQTTFFLEGQLDLEGINDTITYSSSPDDTQDKRREGEIRTLKMGLMRYILETPLEEFIDIRFTEPIAEIVSTDKWNSWVFSTNLGGSTRGESQYESMETYSGISANRVTNEWRISTNANYKLDLSKYHIGDEVITSDKRKGGIQATLVKSLGKHTSAGLFTNLSTSSYNNTKLESSFFPAFEYNVFPYSESTRRQLRLIYGIGSIYRDYHETTIYDKDEELLFSHQIWANYRLIKKWGSININSNWNNYFHDWSKYSFTAGFGLNFRVVKGLNFHFGGNASLVHDQLSLVKGGATEQEILLHIKQLETNYSYRTWFGVSYTFGSIYNNVVNPRFGIGDDFD